MSGLLILAVRGRIVFVGQILHGIWRFVSAQCWAFKQIAEGKEASDKAKYRYKEMRRARDYNYYN